MHQKFLLLAGAVVCTTPILAKASPFYVLGSYYGEIYTVGPGGTFSNYFATGGGNFTGAGALAEDSSGNLYTNDAPFSIDKITSAGVETTYAHASDSNPGLIHSVNSLAFDAADNLYVANLPDGNISVIPKGGGSVSALATGLSEPVTVAVSPKSGLIFATSANTDLIYQITPAGNVSSFVPTYAPIGGGTVFDSQGDYFYVAGNTIAEITAQGSQKSVYGGFGNFFGPLSIDSAGDLFVVQSQEAIVEITPAGGVSTVGYAPESIAAIIAPVPEPASISLIATVGVTGLRRSRRRTR